jgi:hypothetical protein
VHLVYYARLLHIGGWNVSGLSLLERKTLLEPLVVGKPRLQYNGHDTRDGELILAHAGEFGFEGVVSKTIDAPYAPGNRGLWRKAKALNRREFMVGQTTRQPTAGPGRSSPKRSRRHRRLTAPPICDAKQLPQIRLCVCSIRGIQRCVGTKRQATARSSPWSNIFSPFASGPPGRLWASTRWVTGSKQKKSAADAGEKRM